MKDIIVKVIIGVSLVLVIISAVIIISLFKSDNNSIQKEEQITIETVKYELDKKVVDYKFKTIEDYERYISEIGKTIKPNKLQSCINIGEIYNRSIYGMRGSKDGNWVLQQIYKYAYKDLLCRVIKHGEDWSELPLTEHFREKFNPEEGVLNDQYYNYEQGVYLNPGFNYKDRTVVTLCADENGNKYYGWYDFVLNDEGYLDDVIFNHREEITDDILIDG